jgi:hypothetical protein
MTSISPPSPTPREILRKIKKEMFLNGQERRALAAAKPVDEEKEADEEILREAVSGLIKSRFARGERLYPRTVIRSIRETLLKPDNICNKKMYEEYSIEFIEEYLDDIIKNYNNLLELNDKIKKMYIDRIIDKYEYISQLPYITKKPIEILEIFHNSTIPIKDKKEELLKKYSGQPIYENSIKYYYYIYKTKEKGEQGNYKLEEWNPEEIRILKVNNDSYMRQIIKDYNYTLEVRDQIKSIEDMLSIIYVEDFTNLRDKLRKHNKESVIKYNNNIYKIEDYLFKFRYVSLIYSYRFNEKELYNSFINFKNKKENNEERQKKKMNRQQERQERDEMYKEN